jgi:WD40 repeat protein
MSEELYRGTSMELVRSADGQVGATTEEPRANTANLLNGGTARTCQATPETSSMTSTCSTTLEGLELDYREITRLLLQELENLGFHRTAQVLKKEAGITAHSAEVCHFHQLLLSAEWEKAAEILLELVVGKCALPREPIPETLPCFRQHDAESAIEEALFLLFSHKFYELLLQLLWQYGCHAPGEPISRPNEASIQSLQKAALHCLRHQLAPNAVAKREPWRLNRLTVALIRVCASSMSTNRNSLTPAASESSFGLLERTEHRPLAGISNLDCLQKARSQLFHTLQRYISKEKTIEDRRLETLLSRALRENMRQACYPYTTQERPSLLVDLVFNPMTIPSKTWRILKGHPDEVWLVQFSHNGERLLSAGKDGSIVLWNLDQIRRTTDQITVSRYLAQTSTFGANSDSPRSQDSKSWGEESGVSSSGMCTVLSGHADAVCAAAWSPDDRILLSAGSDLYVRLWDTQTGRCLFKSEKQDHAITACAWLKSGDRFVTSSTDCNMYVWEIETDENSALAESTQLHAHVVLAFHGRIFNDITISSFCNQVIGICTERCICRLDVDQATAIGPCVEETENMTALCISRCHQTPVVLVCTSSDGASRPEIHEWDLEHNLLVQRYVGHQQGRFVIRSCFGGVHECFVLSGSEDAYIYIWKRRTGQLFARLSGHTGTVNAVSWSPTEPALFASASDDGTVRLWSTPDRANGAVEMEDAHF